MTNERLKKLEVRLALERRLEELLKSFDKLSDHFDLFAYRHPYNGYFSSRSGCEQIAESVEIAAEIQRKLSEYRTAQAMAKIGRAYP